MSLIRWLSSKARVLALFGLTQQSGVLTFAAGQHMVSVVLDGPIYQIWCSTSSSGGPVCGNGAVADMVGVVPTAAGFDLYVNAVSDSVTVSWLALCRS